MYGQGVFSHLGLAVQSDKDIYVPPSVWLGLKGETLKNEVPRKTTGTLYGRPTVQRQLRGIRKSSGGFKLECLPDAVGRCLALWNGQESVTDVAASGDDPALKKHTLQVPLNVANPLPYLSLLKDPDTDLSIKMWGWMFDKFTLTLGNDMDSPVEFSIEGMGLDFDPCANPSNVTPSDEVPIMNWQAALSIAGAATALLEGASISGVNGIVPVPGLRNVQAYRDLRRNAPRGVTGSVTLGYENQDQLVRLKAGYPFALILELFGLWKNVPAIRFTLGAAYWTQAGGNISGPQRMTESLPFVVEESAAGDDLKVEIWSETASYLTNATAPTVSSVSPVDGTQTVAVDANVVFTMSKAMDPDTINSDNIRLKKVSDWSTVAGALSYNSTTHAITLNPDTNLGNDTDYVAFAGTGLKSADGVHLAAEAHSAFKTAAA